MSEEFESPDDMELVAPSPAKTERQRKAQLRVAAVELDAPLLEQRAANEDATIARARAKSAENQAEELPPWRRGTHAVTRPWEILNSYRRDLLGVAGGRAGWVKRWVRIDSLEDKINKGWSLASSKHYATSERVVGEESQVEASLIRRREMVLVEMPQTWYDELQAAKQSMRDRQNGMVEQQIQQAAEEAQIRTYDPRGN